MAYTIPTENLALRSHLQASGTRMRMSITLPLAGHADIEARKKGARLLMTAGGGMGAWQAPETS